MKTVTEYLESKIAKRKQDNTLRDLNLKQCHIDFTSNDYFGLAKSEELHETVLEAAATYHSNGSGGSRLLSGNSELAITLEAKLAKVHKAEAALLYSNGYSANIGLLSVIAGKNDVIIYDSLCHASLKDGARLSLCRSYSFRHNDLTDLEKKLKKETGNKFVVVEAIYSMDGDIPDLLPLALLCERYNAALIVDEAHANGVIGENGAGLCVSLNLQDRIFARVFTFGKAMGVFGAAIIGSRLLMDYLINVSRTFIYTTALPPVSLIAIDKSYDKVVSGWEQWQKKLEDLISYFQGSIARAPYESLISHSQIQGVFVPGNNNVKLISAKLQAAGIDARPIVSPTVPRGTERIRICLHVFNSEAEINSMIEILSNNG